MTHTLVRAISPCLPYYLLHTGYLKYWTSRFPQLVMQVHHCSHVNTRTRGSCLLVPVQSPQRYTCPWRRRRPPASPGVVCRQECLDRNAFLSTGMPRQECILVDRNASTGMPSCRSSRQEWIPVHSCRQEYIPVDRNPFLSAGIHSCRQEYIPVDRNTFLSIPVTGIHSCRQE